MRSPHFIASLAVSAGLSLFSSAVFATSINLVGTFGSKALVSIDGGSPKKMAVGEKSAEGVTLLSVSSDSATFEIDGQKRTLKMGQHYAASSGGSNPTVILGADAHGHFVTQGMINGSAATFMVDTGASMVAISAGDAQRMNIRYREGEPAWVSTANGTVPAYKVRLESVRIGAITLTGIDALITEAPMPFVLLGMSFLNRVEMQRSGDKMTLTRRY